MDFDQTLDHFLTSIKDKLNKDQIKLWLPPYYNSKLGKNDDEMEKLANNYSAQLSMPVEVCKDCLTKLQSRAIDNLRERDIYQSTGQATLKVRVPNEQGGGNIVNIRIELTNNGSALLDSISKEVGILPERLRVIFKGKVLKENEQMDVQGVKHGLQLMAIILQENTALTTSESHARMLNSTKADVQLLTKKHGDHYLQIADQSGKPLDLPPEEQDSLILAMTLHEKGRAALKQEDYSLALVMLLEAEKEFSHCNSALLRSVDNYGVLNLDIAWCYLNLQSVTQLPDAAERLRQCEISFHQSYGSNLERLIALKGSSGNEGALFMRLHLLQAIVFYHQNKLEEARELLNRAEEELRRLEVDDSQLSQLIELGYSAVESRLALRQAEGKINNAVAIIENKRAERKKNKETEEKVRKLNRERRKLGKCLNGNWIEPQFHKSLMSMGYSYEASRWALAQSNNNIYTSVNLIQDHPQMMTEKVDISEESVQQIINLGFEPEMSKLALEKHFGNVNKAIEDLVANDGYIEDSSHSSSSSDEGPSTSTAKQKERREAYSRVAEGIANTEEDHLDISLLAEAAFLKKYKEILFK